MACLTRAFMHCPPLRLGPLRTRTCCTCTRTRTWTRGGRDLTCLSTVSDVTKDIMALPPTHRLNIYRKAHGNFKAILSSGTFAAVFACDGSVIKPLVPFPAHEAVSSLVAPSTHARCVDTIKRLQDEKKARGVTKWEVVN